MVSLLGACMATAFLGFSAIRAWVVEGHYRVQVHKLKNFYRSPQRYQFIPCLPFFCATAIEPKEK